MSAPIAAEPSARTRYLILALRNATLRNFVANVIAQEQPPDMAAPLAALLDDRSDHLRAIAAQLLGRLNDVPSAARQRLARASQEDVHPLVRQNAQEALSRLNEQATTEGVA